MHMADALLSAPVAGTLWLVAGGALVLASRQLHACADDHLTPMMGMLGAFVFAAQMINFSIPGTGASGHLGGGLLLAILLGPQAAAIVLASVLVVQALFFADGGLMALGANLLNMALLPCCIAYPLVYRPLAGAQPSRARLTAAIVAAAMVGVLLGALGVVLQTTLSGISSLPPRMFGLLMLPIHAAIGLAEGLATAAIVLFLQRTQPELLAGTLGAGRAARRSRSVRPLLARVGLATLLLASVMTWFGSTLPDGLAWSVAQAAPAGRSPGAATALPARAEALQQRLAWMPGYASPTPPGDAAPPPAGTKQASKRWPAVKADSSLAGVVGGGVTALIILTLGLLLRRRQRGQA